MSSLVQVWPVPYQCILQDVYTVYRLSDFFDVKVIIIVCGVVDQGSSFWSAELDRHMQCYHHRAAALNKVITNKFFCIKQSNF